MMLMMMMMIVITMTVMVIVMPMMMMMTTMTMLMIEKTLQCTANGRESNQLQREKAEANYPNRDCSDCAL